MRGSLFTYFSILLCIKFYVFARVENNDYIKEFRSSHAALMKKYLDQTVAPCNDFHQFACGKWHLYNPIPNDKHKLDIPDILQEQASFSLKALLESQENSTYYEKKEDDAIQKTKNFYASCVNTNHIEERGVRPLVTFLRELGGWPAIEKNWTSSGYDWIDVLARTRQLDERLIFDSYVYEDIRSSAENILYIDEPYLGLGPQSGNREFFLKDTKELKAYKNLINNILLVLGVDENTIRAEVNDIVNFEISLANITSSMKERIDLTGRYTRMTIDDLTNNFPNIEWERYFSIVHKKHMETSAPIVVMAKRFAAKLSDLIGLTEKRTVTNYILWRIVQKITPHLGTKFESIFHQFDFAITGNVENPARWKKCVQNTIEYMGMAAGALYVQNNFPRNTRKNIEGLFVHLKKAFQEVLKKKDWLDSSTRILAEEKLEAMRIGVGYPDFILNSILLNNYYKTVNISTLDFFENMLNVYELKNTEQTLKIGRKVNKNEWSLHPVQAKVLYEYPKHQIFVAAALLKPPYYHHYFPQFMNYGGIGTVLAHDMSHGFDDQGAKFDSSGNLRNWWSSSSYEAYDRRTKCVVNQYNNYSINGTYLSGKTVQEEAVADNAGLKVAFLAYKNWLRFNQNNVIIQDEQMPGFNMTKEQMFFVSFAQHLCESIRPEGLSHILQTDTHAIGKYRVNGPLTNSKSFAATFNCPLGSPMNSLQKCRIW